MAVRFVRGGRGEGGGGFPGGATPGTECYYWHSSGYLAGTRLYNNRIPRRNSRFLTISSLRRELSPTRTLKWPARNCVQIPCNTSSAYHVQHAVLRVTWYEGTAQPFRQSLNRIYINFIGSVPGLVARCDSTVAG